MSLGNDRWSKARIASESLLADSPWPRLSLCPSCVTPSLLLVQTVQKRLSCAFRMQSFSPSNKLGQASLWARPPSSASGDTNRGIFFSECQLSFCSGQKSAAARAVSTLLESGVTDASGSLLKAGGSLLRKKKCTGDVGGAGGGFPNPQFSRLREEDWGKHKQRERDEGRGDREREKWVGGGGGSQNKWQTLKNVLRREPTPLFAWESSRFWLRF